LVMRALERDGREAARRQSLENAEVLIALAVPAIGGFIVASDHLARVFAGPAFAPRAAELMPLIGVAVFLNGLRSHYFAQALHLGRRTWAMLGSSIPAAGVNLVLNVLLLPRMGLIGAVWATVVAYAVALVISICQMTAVFPLPFPTREAAKTVGATVIMCLVLRALAFPVNAGGLVSLVLTGGAIYTALVLVADIGRLRSKALVVLSRQRLSSVVG
ncbi:MAG: polysaccharide biosynthesis C-terminal domain-containing protein, partial [Pseudomonadota bacterium]|nr:polysaccharide biosynthesis C-terminal domain-containing protein [Pseudomonadota bacterium]